MPNSRGHFGIQCCLLTLLLLSVATTNEVCATDEGKEKASEESVSIESETRRPYCGLYCLYAVMKLADRETDFQNLIKPEYVDSRKGSSLAELRKAAEDNGLYAKLVSNLTSGVLRTSPHPIILHVKSVADSKEYDHFELFLGTENGQAKIFDPPDPARLVPFHELAPRWDGTGLIVSSSPINLEGVFASARKQLIVYIVSGITLIALIHYCRRRWLTSLSSMSWRKSLGLATVQAGAFVLLSLTWGLIYHFSSSEGFLAHADATASIQQTYIGNFTPKIGKSKLKKLLRLGVSVVDARYPKDFMAGHLENAINVPVNADDMVRQKAMAGIDKAAPIVVYCQSAGCPFAEKVTKQLKAHGFSNISIFKGGWNEWKAEGNDREKG